MRAPRFAPAVCDTPEEQAGYFAAVDDALDVADLYGPGPADLEDRWPARRPAVSVAPIEWSCPRCETDHRFPEDGDGCPDCGWRGEDAL